MSRSDGERTLSTLRPVARGVHVAEAPQRYGGIEVGARMTVLDLGGDLLLHSPVAIERSCVESLGNARWVLAPNLLHHLYVAPWAEAGLEVWGARGLSEKRPDLRISTIGDGKTHPFGDDVTLLPLECFPTTNEVVLLHRPSRTLVVSDLLFNFSSRAPWTTRAAMWCLCGYPGCRTTLLERFGMRRAIARKQLAIIAGWDFDRLIMAHGEIVETGAKTAFLEAFRWLGLEQVSR